MSPKDHPISLDASALRVSAADILRKYAKVLDSGGAPAINPRGISDTNIMMRESDPKLI